MKHRLPSAGAMLAIATFTIVTLAACDSRGTEARTFQLEHMSPRSAESLVQPYVPAGSTGIRISDHPPAITVAASSDRLEQIGEMLNRLDVPAPDVRLRFQLIEADGFADTDPAIADVEAALRELFRFRGYRLAAESMVTASQHTQSTQRLLGFGDTPLSLEVIVNSLTRTAEAGSVHLGVTLRADGHGGILSTGVVVAGGQTVVLGTARPFEDRGALILVVRPEIQ